MSSAGPESANLLTSQKPVLKPEAKSQGQKCLELLHCYSLNLALPEE